MMNEEDKLIQELNNKISECIDKIFEKCYELYGEEKAKEYASKIVNDKNYDDVYDSELNKLIKDLLFYEEEEAKINPFSSFIYSG